MKDFNNNELKKMSKDSVLLFIRNKLMFDYGTITSFSDLHDLKYNDEKQHKRFIMYGDSSSEIILWNKSIVDVFTYLGIYNYTHYLHLGFHKGNPSIYLKYWHGGDIIDENSKDYRTYSTSELIYEIFQLTIFSDRESKYNE